MTLFFWTSELCQILSSFEDKLGERITHNSDFKKNCKACLLGQQHKEKILKATLIGTTKVNQLIHADLMKSMRIALLNGSRFIVVYNDDRSYKSWVYFLKTKGKTLQKFNQFQAMIEAETNNKIEILRIDRKGELLSMYSQIITKQIELKDN